MLRSLNFDRLATHQTPAPVLFSPHRGTASTIHSLVDLMALLVCLASRNGSTSATIFTTAVCATHWKFRNERGTRLPLTSTVFMTDHGRCISCRSGPFYWPPHMPSVWSGDWIYYATEYSALSPENSRRARGRQPPCGETATDHTAGLVRRPASTRVTVCPCARHSLPYRRCPILPRPTLI